MPPPSGRRRRLAGWLALRRAAWHPALLLLVCTAPGAASAPAPLPRRLPPPALCTTAGAATQNMALLAAYAPFADPGMGWGDSLLPLISIKPRAVDRWMRSTPFFCALTPDAPAAGGGAAQPQPGASPALILTRAKTRPHINSHETTQMAAFHWCQLTEEDVAGLGGRGGTVRLVDEATAAALLRAGVDGGQAAGGGDASALACEGGTRFPPPLPPPHAPPGQVTGGEAGGGGGDAYYLAPAEGAPATLLPPPPASYEALAACIGPLYGASAWGLVSWFEHHLDAGVGHFYIYTVEEAWAPGSNPAQAVLAHYAAAGLATVLDWAPVGGARSRWAGGAWYFNQAAAHNDCLNRARGVHRHVIFMDTDEFVEAAGWRKKEGEGEGEGDGAAAPPPAPAPPRPHLDASTGALARAVAAWAASPSYEAMHSIGFPCRWWAMLGDACTRAQLTARDGLGTDPADEPAGGAKPGHPPPPPPPSPAHPPLAPTPCAEPLLGRLPYRSPDFEPARSKFVARPDAVLSVEAHYVLEGAGHDAAFEPGAVHHNHYFILKDGVAAHPTAPRPAFPGANASAPGGGLAVPVPGMMAVLDAAWPARFVGGGLRGRVAEVARQACGEL